MPEDFEECVQNGGKVRTITGEGKPSFGVPKGSYRRICIDADGTVHVGHIKVQNLKGKKAGE